MAMAFSGTAQAARYRCVFLSSRRSASLSSRTQLTTNVQIAAGIISLLNDYQISRDNPRVASSIPDCRDISKMDLTCHDLSLLGAASAR